jgi:hypothetical protein
MTQTPNPIPKCTMNPAYARFVTLARDLRYKAYIVDEE